MLHKRFIVVSDNISTKLVLFSLFLLASIVLILWPYSNIYHGLWDRFVTKLPNLEVSCPSKAQAILVIGQSQASNTGPTRAIAKSNSYMFFNNKCYNLRDPMLGTKGTGGSIWPRLADKLGYSIVISNIAISGSAIEQWTTPHQIKKIKDSIIQLKAAGFSNPLIVLMQGETNGERKTSESSYYLSLKKLVGSERNSKWLLTRESICYDMQQKWAPLDRARNRIARINSNITIGTDIDNIPLSMRQSDRCHLNMLGQEYLASDLANWVKFIQIENM